MALRNHTKLYIFFQNALRGEPTITQEMDDTEPTEVGH